MAKLFKDKAIKKNLEKFQILDLESKIEIVKKWHEAYKNKTLHQKTESQCEQAFNQSFFVELLGYTTFPNEIYTLEPKGRTEATGQKPDAVLGYFSADVSRTVAVVEIKDVNTALDRSQKREGNLSPVQQAFKYKPQYKECDFVIAANFFEIRLHKDNQLDYEQFTLETLASSKDDYFELKKFYYLLCAQNFIAKTGKSKTEELLSDIRVDQDKITKKFYQEYKLLRQDLIRDIVANNSVPKSELLSIVEKAQKIIDRIVFVSFCEDTDDLLPEDTLRTVIKHAENSFSNHWDTLKGFFNAIDKGSEKLGIPDGYNGGLFADDQKLNSLKISDEICKKFLEIGKYDFSEDLSVNILGHIFEQSISDIEEIKSKTVEGGAVDKKNSKRKKDGIFYTPDYIVDYIVKNSLGKYLEEKEAEIKEKNSLKEDITDVNYKKRALASYLEYQSALRNVKVLDPACGSGAFLVKVFDYLLAENIRVANIIADLNNDQTNFMNSEDYIKSLLENNIYGVDLNPESVEITKLSLWLKSAKKGKKLINLNNNIKCGNSLIDDPAVAGDKAFKWEDEFKDIMGGGGFDVIVGNPPYTYRNAIKSEERDYFSKNYHTTEGNYDLYKFFVERLEHISKKSGYCSFIVPNTFLTAKSYEKLRKFILDNFIVKEFFDLGLKIFENVVVESLIFLFKKQINNEENETLIKIQRSRHRDVDDLENEYLMVLKNKSGNDNTFNIYISKSLKPLIEKIQQNSIPLKEICYCTVGINTGYIKADLTEKSKLDARYNKMLGGKDIGRNFVQWDGEWIMYDPDFVKSFKDKGRSLPPREIFTKNKILVQRTRRGMKRKLICYFDDEQYFNLNRLSNIILVNDDYDLKYVYALLNSGLMDYYFNKVFNEYEVKPLHLSQLPIRKALFEEQKPFIQKAVHMLALNKEFHGKLQRFLTLIQSEFGLEKVSRKLEKFYELEFEEFIKELKSAKLSLDKKAELLEFFEKYKKDLLSLKAQIDATDKEIDDMVFDLYGLSEDEKSIILNV